MTHTYILTAWVRKLYAHELNAARRYLRTLPTPERAAFLFGMESAFWAVQTGILP